MRIWIRYCAIERVRELREQEIVDDGGRTHNKALLIKRLYLLQNAIINVQDACSRGWKDIAFKRIINVWLEKKRKDAVFKAEHERLARGLRSAQRLDKHESILRVDLLVRAQRMRLSRDSFIVLRNEFRRQKQMRFTVYLLR